MMRMRWPRTDCVSLLSLNCRFSDVVDSMQRLHLGSSHIVNALRAMTAACSTNVGSHLLLAAEIDLHQTKYGSKERLNIAAHPQ